jgi:hypothetical protein
MIHACAADLVRCLAEACIGLAQVGHLIKTFQCRSIRYRLRLRKQMTRMVELLARSVSSLFQFAFQGEKAENYRHRTVYVV